MNHAHLPEYKTVYRPRWYAKPPSGVITCICWEMGIAISIMHRRLSLSKRSVQKHLKSTVSSCSCMSFVYRSYMCCGLIENEAIKTECMHMQTCLHAWGIHCCELPAHAWELVQNCLTATIFSIWGSRAFFFRISSINTDKNISLCQMNPRLYLVPHGWYQSHYIIPTQRSIVVFIHSLEV